MNRLLLTCLLIGNCVFAQVRGQEKVPNLKFQTILNAPVKNLDLQGLKGKLVWIEFWATWCGPCLTAMPHLQKLQEKYQDQLQVVTVTSESEDRIKLFLQSRPSNLWFAIDTAGSLEKEFPHRLIPHSVLISSEGNLVAITAPENITANVIDSLINGKDVHIPEKKDNLTSDYIKTYFHAEDTLKRRFVLQPEIKGGLGMMATFADHPIFSGRRLTFINVGASTMYSKAFGDFSYDRTINKVEKKEKEEDRFCLDIIVEDPKDLLPTLRGELLKRFALKARVDTLIKDVNVLKIDDEVKFNAISRSKSSDRTYFAMHGKIDQQKITMRDFAEFLESFGTFKSYIIDETGNSEELDIKFSFEPENPNSLPKILKNMGLSLQKAKRKIGFLVLFE